jgi:FtsZ-interacting cell division protein ZipA
MFRARIYAQGFTLVAMVAGSIYWDSDRKRRKEFEDVVLERKAREKNEAWIRELEARDEEEREGRARREARRRGVGVETVREEYKAAEAKAAAARKESQPKTAVILEKVVEEGASSVEVVEERESKKGILESVQALAWGSGKK